MVLDEREKGTLIVAGISNASFQTLCQQRSFGTNSSHKLNPNRVCDHDINQVHPQNLSRIGSQ
jgi:hypothetical protein